ncbi:hypothetical protein [Phaeobacter sp. NW0010-22]|uniref:hypothetical protein n=1 Tax=Phaeobacter sp. NW0010-22 TaxID=3135907 RepID=UPI003105A3FC
MVDVHHDHPKLSNSLQRKPVLLSVLLLAVGKYAVKQEGMKKIERAFSARLQCICARKELCWDAIADVV